MRNLMKVLFVLAATASVTTAASAKSYKWCLDDGVGDTLNCEFTTKKQCLASTSGTGGECLVNPKFLSRKHHSGKSAGR
ncbi:DUF3551 domain-containing protein [Rhodopseudomonas sp. NSM]|uniref:DUF3551 domain-containing protein n=1 Tax=Rhodopseudomonas sp. NSM TaxID=3457630 RepID=UPI004036995B